MSLTLNTNVASLNTQNWLSVNSAAQAKATQQLSSGYQLNSAADDPAGYAIAFKLGVKSAVLQTAINNANQGTAMLQVAQGAMQQIGNILTQLKQIATEAASANDAIRPYLPRQREERPGDPDRQHQFEHEVQRDAMSSAPAIPTRPPPPRLPVVSGIDVSGYQRGHRHAVYTMHAASAATYRDTDKQRRGQRHSQT